MMNYFIYFINGFMNMNRRISLKKHKINYFKPLKISNFNKEFN